MSLLTVTKIEDIPSPEGPQAMLLYTEMNGDSYRLRCLIRSDEIDLGSFDSGNDLKYLVDRYSADRIFQMGKEATLGG